jgi:benzoate membrane transport protein
MAMLPRARSAQLDRAPLPDGTTASPVRVNSIRHDIGMPAITAGMIANIAYLFGATPFLLGVLGTMPLSPAHVSSWFFIVFLTSGLGSIALALRYRQPIAMGWSPAALIFIGSVATRYPVAELLGATLAAGVVVMLLGLTGIGTWLMRWLPLPLVLAMFAGTIFPYATSIFAQFSVQPFVVGATLAGYLVARSQNRAWLPPVGGAVLAGVLAAVIAGDTTLASVTWGLPHVQLMSPSLGVGSLIALVLPLVLLTIATGSIQGIGLLTRHGFRPPVNVITTSVGVVSIVNALFGGHVASLQSASGAVLVGEEAGPRERRYIAVLIAGVGCVVIAVGALVASGLLGVLPVSLVVSLAGLAVLRTLMDAVEQTMTTRLHQGAFFTFIIAASPVTILGLGPALWALLGGYLVSLLLERDALRTCLLTARCDP